MRIAVITCLNDRPEISEIFANTIKHRIQLPTFAGVSSMADESFCLENGIEAVPCKPNDTAGDKWNTVLNGVMAQSDASHVLIMGDDDTISVDGLTMIIDEAEHGSSYIGFKKNYFVDTLTGKAHIHEQQYQADKLCGAGSLISRKAIMDACDMVEINVMITIETPQKTWLPGKHIVSRSVGEYLEGYKGYARIIGGKWHNLWPSKGNGLDHAREMRLVMAGHPPVAVDDDRVHITDFKSAKNIWSYEAVREKFHGPESTVEEAMWFMSESEKDYVRSLIER